MGIAALVIGLVAVVSFANGNTEMGLAQIANLVSIVFSMFNPSCFTGDTPVYTDEGLVCIEEISVGDEVLAYNYETGETELKEVLNVWIKETDEILHLSTSDGETIDTTTNHPFYVDGKGWVAAGDLEIGDTLVTADGDEVEVSDIEIEKLAEPVLVYNLEIEDFHTYFVGEYGVLVHNAGCDYRANFESYTGRTPTGDVHHGFPKSDEFASVFKAAGIDVNDGQYLFNIPKARHTQKVGKGIHTNSSYAGMTWNKAWREFIENAQKQGIKLDKKTLEAQLDAFADLFIIARYRA
ncbi:MAG: polymorphic toxin-type HINT domain-containing protein [Ruminococcus sp.]|nr:polymorphic toxin-type HINT domain-containing protein [Ruminococcus sp.]